MQPTITPFETFSLAELSADALPTTTMYLSADIHTENSLRYQATELLLADMLLSGAGSLSRADIFGAINDTGGSLSITLSGGSLTVSIKGLTSVIPKLRSLLTTILTSATFNATELARAKKTIINQLYEAKEDSRSRAHSALINHYYDTADRRYTYSIEDTIKAVSQVTKKDLERVLNRILSSYFTVSIASDTKTITDTKRWCDALRKSHVIQSKTGVHTQRNQAPQSLLINIPSRQNIDFSIGAPVPISLHHPQYIPFMFGLAVLGKWDGFTGRLMSTVREKEGLTYGIYATLEQFNGPEFGMWRIMTFFAPDKAVQGLTSTFREITTIHTHGITEEELKRFKRILMTGQVLEQDSIGAQLRSLHSYHKEGFTVAEIKERKERISTLTREEVNQALRTYLIPSAITVSGAGPVVPVQKAIQAFHKTMAY